MKQTPEAKERERMRKVARSLSPAQKRAIANAFQASWGDWYVPSATRLDVRWRLVEKGILSMRPGQPFLMLGLKIRAHRNPGQEG